MTGPTTTLTTTHVPVAIISVDPVAKRAEGLTKNRNKLHIDCGVPVGATYVTPSVGDQWYVDRIDNSLWKLSVRIPFNDNNTTVEPAEGQVVIGGTGPVVINGSSASVTGPLQLGSNSIQTDDDGNLVQSGDGGETWEPLGTGSGLEPNTPITPGTHTKITYDADGLVTAGVDAAIADITGLQDALDAIEGGGGVDLPLTTKGDLVTFSTEIVRKGVGTNGTFLKAVTAQPDGLLWANIAIADVAGLQADLDELGDLTAGFDTGGDSILDQIIGLFPDISGGLTGLPGLGAIFGDLTGLLGGPINLGGGLGGISLPTITSIPLIGGLFSGGLLSGGLFPGFDASKIISGDFPTSMISGLDGFLEDFGNTFAKIVQGFVPGFTTGTQADFNTIIHNLTSLTGGINFLNGFNLFDAAQEMLHNVLTPVGALSTWTQIPAHLFGFLSPGQGSNNVLPDASFDDPSTLQGQGLWSWSSTGRTKPGSAMTVAAGAQRQLQGVPVVAQPGKNIDFEAYTLYTSVTSTAGPGIVLAANSYDATDTLIVNPNRVIDKITTPTGNSAGWVKLSGGFLVPTDTAYVTMVLEVEATVITGNVYFDDCTHKMSSGAIDASWLSNIENIPQILAHSVAGIQGLPTLEDLFGTTFDGLGSAFTESGAVTGIQLPNLFELAQNLTVNSATAINFSTLAKQILDFRPKRPLTAGMNATSEVSVAIDNITDNTGALTTVTIAAGTSLSQFQRVSEDAVKGVIEFLATVTGGAASIYTNIYKVNETTGAKAKVFGSADISALITTSGTPNYARSLISGGLAVAAGDLIMLEIENNGSGTITIAVKKSLVVNHPTESPPNKGATRTLSTGGGHAPSSLSDAQITYQGTSPYINFAIADVPTDYHPPDIQKFNTVGTHTYDIPVWAQVAGTLFDRVGIGGGRGGNPANAWIAGGGGFAGVWNSDTIEYGTDIPLGTTAMTVVVGAPGSAGINTTPGGGGGASSVSGTGLPTLTCAGGTGAGAGGDTTAFGRAAGNYVYPTAGDEGSRTYFGGGAVGANATGSPPGGGGGGGASWTNGAAGARGEVQIVARQPPP